MREKKEERYCTEGRLFSVYMSKVVGEGLGIIKEGTRLV